MDGDSVSSVNNQCWCVIVDHTFSEKAENTLKTRENKFH